MKKEEKKVGHTPGPWSLWNWGIWAGSFEEAHKIAEINSTCRHDEETEPNARLIAAAPKLLAALKWIAQEIEWKHDMTASLAIAGQAIAKAEGK